VARDSVFSDLHPEIAEFTFNQNVASVFADMLKRSVPGYGTVLAQLSVFAKKFAQEESVIYDLGCSLGAATFAMAQNLEVQNCTFKSYDTSAPMIARFRELIDENPVRYPVEIFEDDITEISFENASVTVLNLTLQFIDSDQRLDLLKRIHSGTRDGGVLILTEKISDTSEEGIMTDLYYDFKRANSYSELEISQKRTALENVLITDTEQMHLDRLMQAGFSRTMRWFQTLNFRAYLSWK